MTGSPLPMTLPAKPAVASAAAPAADPSAPPTAALPTGSAPAGRGRARLCAVAVVGIWVSFILVARGSARGALTPLDIAWLRFLFSGLMVLPFVWRYRRALVAGLAARIADAPAEGRVADARRVGTAATALRRALLLGGVGGVGYSVLTYSGFFHAPVAHAAVLLPGCLPLWSALAAWWLLGERLTAARGAGLALILVGSAAVAGQSFLHAFEGGSTWRGDMLFVCASVSWALYGVLCRRWRLGALEATAALATVGLFTAVPLYGLAVMVGGVPSALGHAPWGELLFQAVYQGGLAMLVAGYAFTQVVAHYGPVRTTMFTAIVPPLAALAAVPVLGEPLAASALLGLACVTLGLLVGTGAVRWPQRVAQAR